MSILYIKATGFQCLKCGFELPSFFIKSLCLIWFIERYYDLKLGFIFSVNNSGGRQITEFSIDPDNLTVKGPFIYPETVKQPGSFDLMTVARYLNPKVLTYSNMILDA